MSASQSKRLVLRAERLFSYLQKKSKQPFKAAVIIIFEWF